MKRESPPQWNNVSAALRQAGVAARPASEDLSAPHGFAARVASRSRADQRADTTGLVQWRRWSLAGAVSALLMFGGAFLVRPEVPTAPIIPVPTLDDEMPKVANR